VLPIKGMCTATFALGMKSAGPPSGCGPNLNGMKTFLTIPALILFALGTHTSSVASSYRPAPSAKECSDCGCKGPGSDSKCPDEKGKTCHCKKT
jgi:hypothetical protein